MSNEEKDKKAAQEQNKDAAVKPEPETLHTTDPQKNMEGPISSLVKGTGKTLESNETREEADEKKEKNM